QILKLPLGIAQKCRAFAENCHIQQWLEKLFGRSRFRIKRPGQPALLYPDQIGEQSAKLLLLFEAEQPAEPTRNRLVTFRAGALVAELKDFAAALDLADVPFDAIRFPAMRENDVDLAHFFAIAKEIG